jgi:hypothetical protein
MRFPLSHPYYVLHHVLRHHGPQLRKKYKKALARSGERCLVYILYCTKQRLAWDKDVCHFYFFDVVSFLAMQVAIQETFV